MTLGEILIYIALMLSLMGMASPVWCNLHRSMVVIYCVIIGFTQAYLNPPAMPLGYLPYVGAFLSGFSGLYLAFFANIYPDKTSMRNNILISIAGISLLCIFTLEVLVSWGDGHIYNHISKEHYLLYKYKYFMITSAILQVLILLKGGIDGGINIRYICVAWLNSNAPSVWNRLANKTSNEKLQQRDL